MGGVQGATGDSTGRPPSRPWPHLPLRRARWYLIFFSGMRDLMQILGGISAALTTPLDVAKTRIMLAESANQHSILSVLRGVHAEKGVKG